MSRTYNGRFDSPEEPKVSSGWLIGGFLLIPTWPSFFGLVASIACFVKYGKQVKEHKIFELFHRYCSVIGQRTRVPFKELREASPSGTSKSDVRDNLQKMLYRGYFGENAYIDMNRNELVLTDVAGASGSSFAGAEGLNYAGAAGTSVAEKAQEVAKGWQEALSDLLDAFRVEKIFQGAVREDDLGNGAGQVYQGRPSGSKSAYEAFSNLREPPRGATESGKRANPQPEPQPKSKPQPESKPQPKADAQPEPEKPKAKAKPKKRTYAEELESTLGELYQLNEQIVHEGVSQRIDRIGTLTAGIFRVVIEKPEREQDVRKFMNYYLPTTLKLLRSYSMLEQQSYQSESIVESRKKIEGILDTLIQGYEKLLDRLFRDDALDIATDVDVLEMMMAGDGLK